MKYNFWKHNIFHQFLLHAAKQYETAKIPLKIIPGVEISVGYKDRDIHMLGLMIDYKNQALISVLEQIRRERDIRNIKMAENLANDNKHYE